jgi:hypothetical protein
MGGEAYLPKVEMDLNHGIDCFVDVSEIGNEDLIIPDTKGDPYEEQEYYHLAASIKTLEVPYTAEGFDLVYPCRTYDDLEIRLKSAREAYYAYHHIFESATTTDIRWERLMNTAKNARDSLFGYYYNEAGRQQKPTPYATQFENVLPTIVLMPSYNAMPHAYTEGHLPSEALHTKLLISLMNVEL